MLVLVLASVLALEPVLVLVLEPVLEPALASVLVPARELEPALLRRIGLGFAH